ncbi:MAG: 5-(carboxyamino)imidazole ribonucleotide synthase [Flavobacteriales bacterium]|nr:5-(carboxyamino)imidazole ribonucleotide synthase [Flavobacteriales bacterium]
MSYRPKTKLGILGGGQLGRMLIQETINLDVDVHVLDPDPDAPCRDIAHAYTNGSFKDYDTVLAFGKAMDVLTIEIEHVNVDALEVLEKQGVKVYPQPNVIRLIQDKGAQKEFYAEHGIPTSDYRLIGENEAKDHTDFFPVFQKLRTGGYDGKGVQSLKSAADISKAFSEPSVLEKAVDLEKELSVIVARNTSGEVKTFPTVELEFNPVANLVEFLFSPANVSDEVEKISQEIAKTIAEKLEIVGLLAVELFLDKQGNVLVNEIAPRPHNSGHQSIEGNYTSQFMQHVRAILNISLGNTEIVKPSVMVNVLGEDGFSGEAKYEGLEEILAMKGVNVHLYGKRFTKPFRKMGHVTVIAETMEEAKSTALLVKDRLRVISL